ncbi:MAG TPA: winged helix DNA-binding domain-containing protein [Herpetosiphonaceae bacterium]
MATLTWDQVCAWRLARHSLAPRANADPLAVIGRICGLQAQLLPAAEQALWARTDRGGAGALAAGLWEERTLAKTWLMRGTLHIVPAADLPLYAAARQAFPAKRPPSYYTYHGVTPEELAAIEEGVREVLGAEGMTREELADALARRAGRDSLRATLGSGWGALLKPSAAAGDLCFGPNRGQQVTFVRPERWLGSWETIEPQAAIREVARRYLNAYGPASADDFARWWGATPAQGKRVFRELGATLAPVEIDGWQAMALAETLDELAGATLAAPVVNLLPGFDPYVIALLRQEALLDPALRDQVSRPQGWIAPVLLVDGRMAGVWDTERTKDAITAQVTPFRPLTAAERRGAEHEAERLAAAGSPGHAPGGAASVKLTFAAD